MGTHDAAPRVRVSRKLIEGVKLAEQPAYQIAEMAALRAETLSKLLHGALPIQPGDPRVVAVARVVGVPVADAFETSAPSPAPRRGRARRPRGAAAAGAS